MDLNIRPEGDADREAIRKVNARAFGQDGEADLVDALRADGYVRLSLVAEHAGQVVAHILFSDLPILTAEGCVAALALAPMAVLPEFQNQGIGSGLVRHALAECRRQGHRIVVVLGHPAFYPRFGFLAKLAAGLASPFSGKEAFMALELEAGALDGVTGRVQYAPPFGLPTPPSEPLVLSPQRLPLTIVDGVFSICRLSAGSSIPPWASSGGFFSITKGIDELSVVCLQEGVPEDVVCERGWRCLRVAGTMPFSVVGVLAALTTPLAEAGISVFAISTFDTDYLLVKEADLAKAVGVLKTAGHLFS